MGYLHINNLYRSQDILLFKEAYALEKIDGTSTHIQWKVESGIRFFSGGESHDKFVALFDQDSLSEKMEALGSDKVTVYGEGYGGRQQGMSYLYGKELKFIVFDVNIGGCWLAVPQAEEVAKALGLEFVAYEKIPTTLEAIDSERDKDSVQAVRNGVKPEDMPDGKTMLREGVVLRPLIELTKNNGERIISKHKSEKFDGERKTRQKVVDPDKLQVLEEANSIADEWCTEMRLSHVLDKLPQGLGMEGIPQVIKAMVEDVTREAAGEIVDSKDARKAIGRKAAELFKARIQASLRENV